MADSVIATHDLHKRYGAFDALRGVTLDVPAGSICGFLGRNGAGKTTTMKILLGMARPTSGEARVFGLDASDVEIRRRTGFVSEEKDLYPYMTVGEIVRFTASFYPHWRDDLASRYIRELGPHRKIRSLSRGMRTKLALLLAVCRGAELLIVDEPSSGLDPAAQDDALKILVQHGSTVFFSTHDLSEVEQIADHVAIIDRGQIVVSAPLDELRETYRRVELVFENDAPEMQAPGIVSMQRKGRVLTIFADRDITAEARRMNPVSIDVQPVSLKEIFLRTTEET